MPRVTKQLRKETSAERDLLKAAAVEDVTPTANQAYFAELIASAPMLSADQRAAIILLTEDARRAGARTSEEEGAVLVSQAPTFGQSETAVPGFNVRMRGRLARDSGADQVSDPQVAAKMIDAAMRAHCAKARVTNLAAKTNHSADSAAESVRLAYSPEEAAAALGVSRDVIYDLIRTGQLKSRKAAGRRIIGLQQIQEYLSGEIAADQQPR
jgi:excisionase family DNA binding protein